MFIQTTENDETEGSICLSIGTCRFPSYLTDINKTWKQNQKQNLTGLSDLLPNRFDVTNTLQNPKLNVVISSEIPHYTKDYT
jgi:hypothetical protein